MARRTPVDRSTGGAVVRPVSSSTSSTKMKIFIMVRSPGSRSSQYDTQPGRGERALDGDDTVTSRPWADAALRCSGLRLLGPPQDCTTLIMEPIGLTAVRPASMASARQPGIGHMQNVRH